MSAEQRQKISQAHQARAIGASPTKHCPSCDMIKPREEFRKRVVKNRTYSTAYCKECIRIKGRERANDPHLMSQRNRKATLKRYYNLTEDEYRTFFTQQEGRCAICQQTVEKTGKKYLHIDHDHETGIIRGLLCSSCNIMLGAFHDSPGMMGNAIAYLLKEIPDFIEIQRVIDLLDQTE